MEFNFCLKTEVIKCVNDDLASWVNPLCACFHKISVIWVPENTWDQRSEGLSVPPPKNTGYTVPGILIEPAGRGQDAGRLEILVTDKSQGHWKPGKYLSVLCNC